MSRDDMFWMLARGDSPSWRRFCRKPAEKNATFLSGFVSDELSDRSVLRLALQNHPNLREIILIWGLFPRCWIHGRSCAAVTAAVWWWRAVMTSGGGGGAIQRFGGELHRWCIYFTQVAQPPPPTHTHSHTDRRHYITCSICYCVPAHVLTCFIVTFLQNNNKKIYKYITGGLVFTSCSSTSISELQKCFFVVLCFVL